MRLLGGCMHGNPAVPLYRRFQMTKQTTYMNAAGIEKAIKSIQGRGAKLDSDIQTAGLSIINHVAEHGDTTLADRLFDAMPKGGRRVMLAEWFVAFGMIRTLDKKVAEDKAALDAGRHFKIDRTRSTNLDGAVAKPWFEMKPEQAAAEAFDVQKAVKAILAKLGKDGLTIVHKAEALAEAKALLAALTPEEQTEGDAE